MIPTTGAICESSCYFWNWEWIGIAAFFGMMWAITMIILLIRLEQIKKMQHEALKRELKGVYNGLQATKKP